jgi:hypothetical protein
MTTLLIAIAASLILDQDGTFGIVLLSLLVFQLIH